MLCFRKGISDKQHTHLQQTSQSFNISTAMSIFNVTFFCSYQNERKLRLICQSYSQGATRLLCFRKGISYKQQLHPEQTYHSHLRTHNRPLAPLQHKILHFMNFHFTKQSKFYDFQISILQKNAILRFVNF